jgi:hypothetical protein
MKKMIFTLYWYLNFPSLRSTWVFPFSSSGSFSLHPICARYIISLARCFVFLFVICLPRRRRPICRAAELFHLRAQDFLVFVLDAAGYVILLPFSILVPSSSRVDSCSRSHRACQIPAPEVANQGCSLCWLVSLLICAPVLSRHMTGNKKWFSSLTPLSHKKYVTFRDDKKGKVLYNDIIKVNDHFTFNDVTLVDRLRYNLLSISQLVDADLSVLFHKSDSHVLYSSGKHA